MISIKFSFTYPLYASFASLLKSLVEPRIPTSFSTCIAKTVCSFSSKSFINFMKVLNALISTDKISLLNMLKILVFIPASLSTLGNLTKSSLTQLGAYVDKLFFQLPNHSSTSLTLFARASIIKRSTILKSNSFSCFSIIFQ